MSPLLWGLAAFVVVLVGCAWAALIVSDREAPAPSPDVDALQAVHRAQKAQLRDERDQAQERLSAANAALAAEQRLTLSLVQCPDCAARRKLINERTGA